MCVCIQTLPLKSADWRRPPCTRPISSKFVTGSSSTVERQTHTGAGSRIYRGDSRDLWFENHFRAGGFSDLG